MRSLLLCMCSPYVGACYFSVSLFLFVLVFLSPGSAPGVAGVDYAPRGWNSYDCFLDAVDETQFRANVDGVAQFLAPHGYEFVTIDYYWYLSADHNTTTFDGYGRPQPDPQRFPSSRNGAGFKPLADYVHSKGLKFGIHLMRGIHLFAAEAKYPVYGSTATTDQIIDNNTLCDWSSVEGPFYSVDLSKNGGMQFYLSLYSQYADWGVDFIKYDCVFGEDFVPDQIIAASKSIMQSGRPMVLSLSPGIGSTSAQIDAVASYVDIYRITVDVWDNFQSIENEFQAIESFYSYIGGVGKNNSQSFPDLDMLPFGWLSGQHWSGLSRAEQRTMFVLQCFNRSPLIYGGDLSNPDFIGLDLVTNDQLLYIQRYSKNNRPLQSPIAPIIIWTAQDSDSTSSAQFLAFFNADSSFHSGSVSFQQLIGASSCVVFDIIAGVPIGNGTPLSVFNVVLDAHDAIALKLTNCQNSAVD